MHCEVETIAPGAQRCKVCERIYHTDQLVMARCRKDPTRNNFSIWHPCQCGLLTKMWNFAGAVATWNASGRPVTPTLQLIERHAACLSCPMYRAVDKTCGECGCPVNDSIAPLFNKLAMATERCPLEPPRWDAI